MTLSGRVAIVRIQDENDEDGLRTFSKAKLTLTDSRSRPQLIITIPGDDDIELDLNGYSYVDESSEPGEIDCIRNDSKGQTVILMDQKQECTDLLKKMRDYLSKIGRKRSPSPSARRRSPSSPRRPLSPRHRSPSPPRRPPSPRRRSPFHRSSPLRHQSPELIDNKNVNDLIRALHNGNEKVAADIARVLARDKQPIRFALNMINESGNAAPPPKPEPVIPPINLKLLIESFLIGNQDTYDVAILPQTTIENLKQLVQRDAGIPPEQQYWYINRDLLRNDYKFDGSQHPRLDDKTVLVLYIAKS